MVPKIFYPNKKKVILSLLATLVWHILYSLFYVSSDCSLAFCVPPEKPCDNIPQILRHDCCGCPKIDYLIGDIFIAFIIPFVFFYIILSVLPLISTGIKRIGNKRS